MQDRYPGRYIRQMLVILFIHSFVHSFIQSFVHFDHLYRASSRKLFTGGPNSRTAKKSNLKVIKECRCKVPGSQTKCTYRTYRPIRVLLRDLYFFISFPLHTVFLILSYSLVSSSSGLSIDVILIKTSMYSVYTCTCDAM